MEKAFLPMTYILRTCNTIFLMVVEGLYFMTETANKMYSYSKLTGNVIISSRVNPAHHLCIYG